MAMYNPYNYNLYNPYIQEYQAMKDRIDNNIRQMQMQQQNQMIPQQPQVTQNFQLAPMQNNSELIAKTVSGIDEVKNTFVSQNGIFINKDMDTLWFKNISGDIKTYTLQEVIEIDPKDNEIANLKNELANMRQLLNQQISQTPKIDNQSEVAPVKTEKKSK